MRCNVGCTCAGHACPGLDGRVFLLPDLVYLDNPARIVSHFCDTGRAACATKAGPCMCQPLLLEGPSGGSHPARLLPPPPLLATAADTKRAVWCGLDSFASLSACARGTPTACRCPVWSPLYSCSDGASPLPEGPPPHLPKPHCGSTAPHNKYVDGSGHCWGTACLPAARARASFPLCC